MKDIIKIGTQSLESIIKHPEMLTTPQLANAVKALKGLEEQVAKARKVVADYAKSKALESTDKERQTHRVEIDGFTIEVRPNGREWNDERVLALLRARKVDPAKYMEVKYAASTPGMKALAEEGIFSEADIASCRKPTQWALWSINPIKEVNSNE